MRNENSKTGSVATTQRESMEVDTISKNGRYSKSLVNIGKKVLFLLIACITLCGSVHAQSEMTYSFWTGVRVNGKPARPKQIKEVLSVNKAALKHYNTGRTLEMAGSFVAGIGMGLFAVDIISNGFDNLGTLSSVGWITFGASFAFFIPGSVKMGNSIRLYNSSLSSYKTPPSQLYFGFTPSGGVGLTMRF